MRRLLCLLLGLSAWLLGHSGALAQADGNVPQISWTAPAECPDQAAMQQRVAALLAASQVSSAQVSAAGEISEGASGLELSLRIDVAGRSGNKTLHADRCAVLADTAAWLIAVAVDPAVEPPPPTPEPEAKPEPQAEPKPDTPTVKVEPKPQPEPRRPSPPAVFRARVGVTGGVWGAGLAGPTGALGGHLGLARNALYMELGVAHAFKRNESLPSKASLHFASQQFALRVCGEWPVFSERLRGGPCGEVSLVRTVAGSSGLEKAATHDLYWASGGLAAHAHFLLIGPLELTLAGGIGLPLSARPQFQVGGGGKTVSVSFTSAHLELGFSLRYP